MNKTHVVSDGFLDGEALVVDVLGVPDGEDGVGRGGAGQPRPGHLQGVCVNMLTMYRFAIQNKHYYYSTK